MNILHIIVILIIAYYALRVFVYRIKVRRAVKWTTRLGRSKRNGYIYFFRGRREAVWQVKIGRTNNLEQRLRAHRTANPYGVVLLAAFKTHDDVAAETYLHHQFAANRISKNNEWFNFSPKLWLTMVLLKDSYLTQRVHQWLQ